MRCTGNDQGQWLDNEKAEALLNDIKIAQPTKTFLPERLRKVIKPDGAIVQAKSAILVPRGDAIRTDYPTLEP
jgi:hypothetical protein